MVNIRKNAESYEKPISLHKLILAFVFIRICEILTWVIHETDPKHGKKHWYPVADYTHSIVTRGNYRKHLP